MNRSWSLHGRSGLVLVMSGSCVGHVIAWVGHVVVAWIGHVVACCLGRSCRRLGHVLLSHGMGLERERV